jgi:hypothetical protein
VRPTAKVIKSNLVALRLIANTLPHYTEQLSTIDLSRRFGESAEVFMLDADAADAFRLIDQPAEKLIDPELDSSLLSAAICWQGVKNTIEVDLVFLPSPVTDHDRPYFPGLLIAVVEGEQFIVGFSMLSPIPDYASSMAKLASAFLDALSQHQVLPDKVLVRNRQVLHSLGHLSELLGIELSMRSHLPAAEAAINSMRKMMFTG